MAFYEPPREILNIFDAFDFISNDDEPLTMGQASKYFLKYPIGQGLEQLPALQVASTTNLNTLNVSGLSDFNDNVNISVSGSGVANPTLTIQSNNDDDKGAYLKFYKNSQSPADGDRLGCLTFWSRTLNGSGVVSAPKEFARFRATATDYTHNNEDAKYNFMLMKGGSLEEVADLTSNELLLKDNINFLMGGTGTITQSGSGQNELKSTNVVGTFLVNGSPVSGGGSLAQTLQAGNSAGSYSINMNSNNIENINNLYLSTPAITGEKYIYMKRALNTSNNSGLGTLSWSGLSSTSVEREYATMNVLQSRTNNTTEGGQMIFNIMKSGTKSPTMKLGYDSTLLSNYVLMNEKAIINSGSDAEALSLQSTNASGTNLQLYNNRVPSVDEIISRNYYTSLDTASNTINYGVMYCRAKNNVSGSTQGEIQFGVDSGGAYIYPLIMNDTTIQLEGEVNQVSATTNPPMTIEVNNSSALYPSIHLYKSGNSSNSNGMGVEMYADDNGGNKLLQARMLSGWISNIGMIEDSQLAFSTKTSGVLGDTLLLKGTTSTFTSNLTMEKGTPIQTFKNTATPATGFDIMNITANAKDSANSTYYDWGQMLIEGKTITSTAKQGRYYLRLMRDNTLENTFYIDDLDMQTNRTLQLKPFYLSDTLPRYLNFTTNAKTDGTSVAETTYTGFNSANVYTPYATIKGIEANATSGSERGRLEFYAKDAVGTASMTIGSDNSTTDSKITNNLKTYTTQGLDVANGFKITTAQPASTTDITMQFDTTTNTEGLGIDIYKNQTGFTSGETIGEIDFYSNTSTATKQITAKITCVNNSNTAIDGEINLITYTGGTPTNLLEAKATAITANVPLVVNNSFKPQTITLNLTGNVNYSSNLTFLGGYLIIASNTSTANTITLPAVANSVGYMIFIRNESLTAFNISSTANFIGAYGSQTTTFVVSQESSVKMYSDGTNYNIFEEDCGTNAIDSVYGYMCGTPNIIETIPKQLVSSPSQITANASLVFTGFCPTFTKTINTISVYSNVFTTAFTYINIGIYTQSNPLTTLTRVAISTPITQITARETIFTLTTPYQVIKNTYYAVCICFYTSGTFVNTQTLWGGIQTNSATNELDEIGFPLVRGQATGSTLPASINISSITSNRIPVYFQLR